MSEPNDNEEPVETGRLQEMLKDFIGQRLVMVTGDSGDDAEDGNEFALLHFERGHTLRFPVSEEGFTIEVPE